ncbi:hypothetical protein CR513_42181, partial [Mucuna pruriens]
MDYDQVWKQRQFQLQELDELCLEAYKNSHLEERVLSWLESTTVQFTFEAHRRWDGLLLSLTFSLMV